MRKGKPPSTVVIAKEREGDAAIGARQGRTAHE